MKIGITFFSIWCFLYLFFVSGSLVLFDCTPTRRGSSREQCLKRLATAGIRNLHQQVKYALRFFVVETALHQNPKHLSLSPPSRTAASASSQAGGESALEPLSTDKGCAGSQITQKNKKSRPYQNSLKTKK